MLIDAYQQWAGRREAPRIAILDWQEVPSYSEFVMFADYFKSQGIECVIADPREVEYRDGRLMAGKFHITLIYKRVLISELVEHGGLYHPVIQAVRDGKVCMVNPFRCKICIKRRAWQSSAMNATLTSSVPRNLKLSKPISPGRAASKSAISYPRPEDRYFTFILKHREKLVLKPNDEYGGKGIVLGWETDPVMGAGNANCMRDPYIVQERVTIPSEPFPAWSMKSL